MKPSKLPQYLFAALSAMASQAWSAQPVTIVFQNGVDGYEGTFDRLIGPGGEIDGSFVTGNGSYTIDGGGNAVNDALFTQSLIRFGGVESSIPAGAKILDAKVTVVTKNSSSSQSGDSFSVYRLTAPFTSETSVTTDFGADGINGQVDWILGSFHGPNVAGEESVVSADVTRAVQSWIDGSPNNGVGIRSDRGTNGWGLHSTGAVMQKRPKLEVTYLLEEGVQVNDFQQGLNGYVDSTGIFLNGQNATSENPGNTIVGWTVQEAWLDGLNPPTTEADISGMLRFGGVETALAGRKIESAILKIVTGFSSSAADSPGPFTLHRLLVPFDETSQYINFAGDTGAMLSAGQITPAIATFTDMQDCEVVDLDITEAVKSWAAGEPNHGFYIGSGTPNGWQVFTTGATDISFRPLLRVISSPPLPVEIVTPGKATRHPKGLPINFLASTSVIAPATAAQVEFFLDGISLGTDTTAPFSLTYPADQLGNYVLKAVLTDSGANVISSEEIAFSVIPIAGNEGLYFDGISDHVAMGDPAELKLSTFTLETWFRRETTGVATTTGAGGVTAIPLVAKGRNQADGSVLDTNWFLGIREIDGVLCTDFEGASGANVPVHGVTPVPYGEWQHAAATFDGTALRIYLNGNLEGVVNAKGVMPRADSIQHASIATAMNSNGLGEGFFGGFMDEVRIWNLARSHDEIRQTINKEVPTATGLAARWAMNEGSGTTVSSTSSAGTIGTFGGKPVRTTGVDFTNNVHPSVAFTSPVNGGNYLKGQALQISVNALDPDGSVVKVEYFDNGVSIGSSTTAPFAFNYANPPVGTRRLVAVVTDNHGDTARTDNILTVDVTFVSPTVPGYTAGLIDGGDIELFGGTPAADPAPWSVVSSTPVPRAFTAPGTTSGDIAVNVNGNPLAFDAGILFASNRVANGNFASIDNLVAPYAASGVYRVSSKDNSGPGELEPILSPESSSFSLGWFPYAQGWIGANIAADGAILGGSSSLPSGVTINHPAAGVYQLTGLPTSGNLLALTTGRDTNQYTAIAQSGDNWIVSLRGNNQNLADGNFAILYIPATANRILSGKVGNLGEFTPLNEELAGLGATTRLTPQGYEITFGNGSEINPSNTELFISGDSDAGNGADNVYSYSANGNSFVVFSHDLPGLNGALQNGGFRFLATPLNPTAPVAGEVNLTASDTRAAEDGGDQMLVFTVSRRGATGAPLTVNYTVTGTAASGIDYTALPGSVTIPAGSSSAQITVSVLADSELEPEETVIITLAPGTGYSAGLSTTGTGRIANALSSIPTTTVVFQEGLGGYTGQFQKSVGYSSGKGTYSAQLGSAVANYAVDGGDPDVNDLIRFDNIIGNGAGMIPAGATVLKAQLVLTTAVAGDAQSNGPFIVNRLTSPVTAATTYSEISNGAGYEGVRGISTTEPVAGFPALAQGEAGAADVTAIVRAWANGASNHGFGIYSGGTGDAWNYDTVGNASVGFRPKLVVTYITRPTREYTFITDRSARIDSTPGASTVDGSTLDTEFIDSATNNSQDALLHFPVAFGSEAGAIPLDEEILKAELLVTTAGSYFSTSAQSPGPIHVHQMLEDWNTTTSYGLHGPQIGTQLAESSTVMTGLGQDSTTWIDITAIVRNWRAGAPNHGVDLRPGTGDDWMFFWPGTIYGEIVAPRLRITTAANGTVPEPSPFEQWAQSFGSVAPALNSDNDHDGISALIEYALGLRPTASDALPGVTRNGDFLTIAFPKGTLAAGDSRVAYRIMSSPDLDQWSEEITAVEDSTAITLTQSASAGPKFFRLEVVYTP